jgi:ABC-type multidrug transport system fused ATPase/permease subunit
MKRSAFWKTTLELLRYKKQLTVALCGALVSAACFGAGLSMLLPVFTLFFKSDIVQSGQHPLKRLINDSLTGDGAAQWKIDLAGWLNGHIPENIFWSFVLIVGVIATLTVVGSFGRYIHELLSITVTQQVAVSWRDRLFRKLVDAPVSHFLGQNASDHASRAMFDTAVLARGHMAVLGKALPEVLKGAAAVCVALWLDYRLTLLALIAAPVSGVVLYRFGRVIEKASRRALQEQSGMLKAVTEVLGALHVIKTHGAEGYERRRFRRLNRRLFDEQMKMRQARALSSPVIETLGLFCVLIAALVAAWYVFQQNVDPATFLLVLISLAAAGASLKPLTALHVQIKEADAAAKRMIEGAQIDREPIALADRADLPVLARHQKSIEFDAVSYAYRGQDTAALDNVSLRVEHGQTIAIVGTNGSGKTTLLNLLPRLTNPSAGRVLIDGTDIAGVNLKSLRRQMAIVPQQSVLFEGTIADNIAYGLLDAKRDQIEAAARAAFAHDFVDKLPKGYDTPLGEGGSGLSGGQKQRLCIARAILRDPAILILDEATSQIDADSEAKINRALDTFRAGRTTFIIAHRLSTVVDCDMIVVMNAGQIVDRGTHTELLERCDIYRTLTHTQLQPAQA